VTNKGNGTTLIIGASSTIAQALIQELLDASDKYIIAVSRSTEMQDKFDSLRVHCIDCDYSTEAIEQTTLYIQELHLEIDQVIICNGLLHQASLKSMAPEKKLEDVELSALQQSFQANMFIPLLWLSNLPRLVTAQHADIVVFSARVGSIADNRLGGWVSYRSSKAALNMALRCAAIEYKRSHKTWRFVLYHPGTTATPLSEPFQKNVPADKLFTPQFTASQLLTILPTLAMHQLIHYIDWQGQTIEW
jgi:NAD(P)-dependent dehydrogenase (short-subunit alcohol dehydrogenase family)